MSVQDLIRKLQDLDPTVEVFVNDDSIKAVEPIETDDGPAVILWGCEP